MKWYAIYTNPRAEKRVNEALLKKGIDAYLPLQKTLKQWSDRKKWVEEPLFRSYLFVNISSDQYLDVLNTNGVVRYISFEGNAVMIPPQQIEAIRMFLEEGIIMEGVTGDYSLGSCVEIIHGPVSGLIGELIEQAGKHRVKIEIAGVEQSIYLTLPKSHLRAIKN